MTDLVEIKKLRCEFAGLRTKSNLTGDILKALVATIGKASELFRKNTVACKTGLKGDKRQVYWEGRWRNVEDIAFFSSPN